MQNITVSSALLDEWRALLEKVASVLQSHYDRSGMQEDEDLAVICEQTAEYIEKVGRYDIQR